MDSDRPKLPATWHVSIIQIDAASNDTKLEILDDSTNIAIINSSSWPVTKCIDCRSKFQLGQTLLIEVLHKREANIRALRRGMHVLGFFKLCNEYPEKTKPLFLYTPAPLDSSQFSLMHERTDKPADNSKHAVAFTYFMKYINERAKEGELMLVLHIHVHVHVVNYSWISVYEIMKAWM